MSEAKVSRRRRNSSRTAWHFESLESRQLLSCVIDVRLTNGGGKSVQVTNVGQVVQMQVWAVITGSDTNPANDGFQSTAGSFLSSHTSSGSVRGNLSASNAFPFDSSGAQPGARQDLNGDGDKDVGSNDTNSFANTFNTRDGSFDYNGVHNAAGNGQSFLIANVSYTVTSVSSGAATNINYRLRVDSHSTPAALWTEDGVGKNEFVGSFKLGAPVVITGPTTQAKGSISGNLFNDLNGNGSRQSGEPNLSGRKFYIDSNKNGKLDSGEPTATTDSNGNYKFSNLAAGTYRIRQSLPSGWRVSLPTTAWSQDVIVASGQNVTGKNFADAQMVYISGYVFNDINSNASKGTGEGGLSSWRAYIDLNNDGKFETNEPSTLTDSNGNYKFTTLSPGTFHLRVTPPSGVTGYKATTPSGGVYTFSLSNGGLTQNKIFGEHKS